MPQPDAAQLAQWIFNGGFFVYLVWAFVTHLRERNKHFEASAAQEIVCLKTDVRTLTLSLLEYQTRHEAENRSRDKEIGDLKCRIRELEAKCHSVDKALSKLEIRDV